VQTAKILGTTDASTKHQSLAGRRLVIVQPVLASGAADGSPLIAIDSLGSQRGDLVMITSDSLWVRQLVGDPNTPARWSVLGNLDPQV
jgi:ethanolamine utilization protein EutN